MIARETSNDQRPAVPAAQAAAISAGRHDHLGAVIHIVPTMSPNVSGVGDYAATLATAIGAGRFVDSFMAAGICVGHAPDLAPNGKPVARIDKQTPEALVAALDRIAVPTILLHFSGYGYARWALCFWLTEGLARWKAAAPGRHLVVMFHELYANGPPWRASFWTSFPQRRNARRLAALADHVVCGYQLIGDRVHNWLPDRPVHVLPVFSNVGELDQPAPLAEREAKAIVFGGRRRSAVYRRAEQLDPAVLDRLGIERILDIGPPISTPSRFAGRPVELLGILPADEVSRHMASARLGLADYARHVAAKSSILAAYHAHGLLALNLTDRGMPMDGLVEGEHYAGCTTMTAADLNPARIAAAGHRWYQGHDRASAAALFARLLDRPAEP